MKDFDAEIKRICNLPLETPENLRHVTLELEKLNQERAKPTYGIDDYDDGDYYLFE